MMNSRSWYVLGLSTGAFRNQKALPYDYSSKVELPSWVDGGGDCCAKASEHVQFGATGEAAGLAVGPF